MLTPFGQSNHTEQVYCSLTAFTPGPANQGHGHFDILLGRQVGDQVAGALLPDKTHLGTPVAVQSDIG